jgi:hypothetical protein
LFIGNLSSPLAFAYCLHKKCIVGLSNSTDDNHQCGLDNLMTNIINTQGNLSMEQLELLCD